MGARRVDGGLFGERGAQGGPLSGALFFPPRSVAVPPWRGLPSRGACQRFDLPTFLFNSGARCISRFLYQLRRS